MTFFSSPPSFRPRLEALEDRHLLTFGIDGIVLTDVAGTTSERVNALALQPDGKIVAAGVDALARYNTDGSLDTSFNSGGPMPGTTTVPASLNDLALQTDGKIVAGGWKSGPKSREFVVRRYTAAGTPDATFGSGGEAVTDVGKNTTDEMLALALQPDGKIVTVGTSFGNASHKGWPVVRYNANGTLDTTFDGDGKLMTWFGTGTGIHRAHAVAVLPGGKILVAGEVVVNGTGNDYALVRYNANGSLDTTFGTGGKVLTDFQSDNPGTRSDDSAYDMAIQPDGKIVLVGLSSNNASTKFTAARYNADGSLESTFDGNGKLVLTSPAGGGIGFKAVAVQSDGKIVAAGGYGNAFVFRLNGDGSLDTTFNATGWQQFQFDTAEADDDANDVLIQPDGKIVVGGSDGYGPYKFALARLNTDGAFDAGSLGPTSPPPPDITEALPEGHRDDLFREFADANLLAALSG